LDFEVTLTTFVTQLLGDPGPRLLVVSPVALTAFTPRLIANNKLRFEGVPVEIGKDTRVILSGLRCDCQKLAISAAFEPRPIWMFLSVNEGPRTIELSVEKIPLGLVKHGAWISVADAKQPYEQVIHYIRRSDLSETPTLVGWLKFVEGFPGAFKTAAEEVGGADRKRFLEGIPGTRFFAGFQNVPDGMRVFVSPFDRLPGGTRSKSRAMIVPDSDSDGVGGTARLVPQEWIEVGRRSDLIDLNLPFAG